MCPSEESVIAFLGYLIVQRVSYYILEKIIAGVSFFFKLMDFPACNSFLRYVRLLKGIEKVISLLMIKGPFLFFF